MYGGRQFLMGLLLGGLGVAFARTAEGQRLLESCVQSLTRQANQQTQNTIVMDGEKKDIPYDRTSEGREDSRTGDV